MPLCLSRESERKRPSCCVGNSKIVSILWTLPAFVATLYLCSSSHMSIPHTHAYTCACAHTHTHAHKWHRQDPGSVWGCPRHPPHTLGQRMLEMSRIDHTFYWFPSTHSKFLPTYFCLFVCLVCLFVLIEASLLMITCSYNEAKELLLAEKMMKRH